MKSNSDICFDFTHKPVSPRSMPKIVRNEFILPGLDGRNLVCDITYDSTLNDQPLIVFAHGFKGFKDWGHFSLMAEYFSENGYAFLKFNFSHNGGSEDDPIDFPDLEAFGQNTFSKELNDLKQVFDFAFGDLKLLKSDQEVDKFWKKDGAILMGHSRGGGVTNLFASKDSRVSQLISLASVSDFKARFPQGQQLREWESKGVEYIENGRTKQQMPLYFTLYRDFVNHEQEYTIERATRSLTIPHLIVHGSEDQVVKEQEGRSLYEWSKQRADEGSREGAVFKLIDGGDHVFSSSHPFKEEELNTMLKLVMNHILEFIMRY